MDPFFLLLGNGMMCHPSITRFFGIGLTPLPATYTCKKLGCTQILFTIIHLILLLNCLDFFDPYYLVIVNVVFGADHVISTGRQMTNFVSNFECLF